MVNSCVLPISILCFLVLTTGGSAYRHEAGQQQQAQCRIQSINPLEPARRLQHEAGYTDVWDQTFDQIQCAGVAASRHLIQQGGLLLPTFSNAPLLAYVVKGRGIVGTINPGCAETFQSSEQIDVGGQFGSQKFRDQHQKIHRCRKGDIVAFKVGVAHWVHNDGNEDLELMVVHDTSNVENQLDQNLRRFFLAGNPQESEMQQRRKYSGQQQDDENFSGNLFQGFETEVLAESFQVDMETAARLQGQDDNRGFIVRVGKEFEMQRPSKYEEEERRREWSPKSNRFEETVCTMRIRENLDDPERADVYTAQGGRISTVNSHNLPILKEIQLSAERGVLYENAMAAPHWTLNAHNIIYILRGTGRIQVVGHSNRAVFNGEVRQGQLLVVPQNYAEVKLAGNEGLEWVSFKTNDRAISSPLAGKTSVIRAMPVEVVMSAFRMSRDEAQKLKYNRQEVRIFPRSKRQSERI
ncbi:11S globulin seed storage protein Ana o 2.0101-like [Impatiens glandulifera]|uniref:11S globulin seed storage protein Ana o 2.0101-like n=1 Tax=Impatiens glandulifera TaxID=253017 RepID=UPI001FB0E40D|nr:11S globulin seed storage protein Ana o 2.0101-like [Impatiens glandulifera]XP_047306475.1 11S globulin seed storage protein Ana o 2.0101-like [Impatiens glandulifera]XP_047306476.1 11S globulin seed storage protein Ana o 2.0101-like [Impatiens glandulifera]